MKIFDISQTENHLVLEKRHPPQLLRGVLTMGIIGFLSLILINVLQEPWNVPAAAISLFGLLMLGIVLYQAVPQLIAVVKREIWEFDLEQNTIVRGGKVLDSLDQIYSVRVWEECDGEGALRRLAVQQVGDKPIIISDALTQKEWDELNEVARRISAFTGIKLVKK